MDRCCDHLDVFNDPGIGLSVESDHVGMPVIRMSFNMKTPVAARCTFNVFINNPACFLVRVS